MKNILFKNTSGYNYKYTDLAEINRVLAENGITYYQYTETVEGIDYIFTVFIVDGEEGTPRRGCKVVNAPLSGKSNPAQEYGSALTYARRYSLLMAAGLATTDDDAACMDRPKEEPASKAQIQAFKDACKASEVDATKVMTQVGWQRGVVITSELLGKATAVLKEINEEKANG